MRYGLSFIPAQPLQSPMTYSPDNNTDCVQEAGPLGNLSGHVIICGAEGSFVNFVEQLRRCDPMPTPVVVLHPRRPSAAWSALKALGPIHFVAGEFSAVEKSLHGTAVNPSAHSRCCHSSSAARSSVRLFQSLRSRPISGRYICFLRQILLHSDQQSVSWPCHIGSLQSRYLSGLSCLFALRCRSPGRCLREAKLHISELHVCHWCFCGLPEDLGLRVITVPFSITWRLCRKNHPLTVMKPGSCNDFCCVQVSPAMAAA